VKGKQVSVAGELRQNRWETEGGQKRSKVEIHALNVQLLGGSKDSIKSVLEKEQTKHGNESRHGIPEDFEDDIPF
jgi:single-strand DNA-binding protein